MLYWWSLQLSPDLLYSFSITFTMIWSHFFSKLPSVKCILESESLLNGHIVHTTQKGLDITFFFINTFLIFDLKKKVVIISSKLSIFCVPVMGILPTF